MAANHSFVWFDGLNRFYIAGERSGLLDAFYVPPNVFDGLVRATKVEARWEADTLRASLAGGLPPVFLHSVGDASVQWLCRRFHASPLAYAICLFSGAYGVGKLISAARGRPVLRGEDIIVQASAPQAAHGRIHVYLWRHPWDQFCAGQSNDQRDASSLTLLTAADAPQVLVTCAPV